MSLTFRPPSFLHPLPNLTNPIKPHSKPPHKIVCLTNKPNNNNNSELSSELITEIHKLKTQSQDKHKAMIQSKHLLFSDFCAHLNLTSDDLKIKWRNSSDDDKLTLVQGFVSHWGLSFHPLSSKSVKDLVEEFVVVDSVEHQRSDLFRKDDDYDDGDDDEAVFFPNLKKLFMGFSSDTY